jgi:hypothetical protein
VSGPAPLGYLLAAVMIVTAGYCVTRLLAARLRGRPTAPAADTVHVVMGVAMAGMLVPRLNLLPAGAWEAVFGAAAGWFGWQVIRACLGNGGRALAVHQAPHLLASGAMLYMFLAVSPVPAGLPGPATAASAAMGGHSAGTIRFPFLAFVFALALLGYVVWVTDRLPALAPGPALRQAAGGPGVWPGAAPHPRGAPLSPRLAACCEIVMGITMGYMLIVML